MLQNAYLLAKIGSDTAENERHFAENLPKIVYCDPNCKTAWRRAPDLRIAWACRLMQRVRNLAEDVTERAVLVPVYGYSDTGNPNLGRPVLGCIEAEFCN